MISATLTTQDSFTVEDRASSVVAERETCGVVFGCGFRPETSIQTVTNE